MEQLPVNSAGTSLLRRVFKGMLWLLFSILFLFGALIAILFIYEDEVKAAIVKELNKHLKAEVKIDPKNIDLTIIKSFPDCSIRFKDILMLDALPLKNRDTLLYAGQLSLHFNISDLWQKKYNIQKMALDNSVVKLKVLKNGMPNYIFWQESKSAVSSRADSVHFNLSQVTIENCRFSYLNKQQLIKTNLTIKKIMFSGDFGQSQFNLETQADLFIGQLVHRKNTYLKNKNLHFAIEMAVSNNQYTFKKTNIRLNDLVLNLAGAFQYRDSLQDLRINYNAPDMDIGSVLSLLPETFRSKINDYGSSGNFYARGQIVYSGQQNYAIASEFGIKNSTVTYKPHNVTATGVNVTGHLKVSQNASQLDLDNVYCRLNGDELKGSCMIRNFSDPYLKLSSDATIHLENLLAFFPIDTLTQLKGALSMHSDVEGLVSDLKNEAFSTKVKLNLNASVTNLVAQFKNDTQVFSVENCSVIAQEREIEVKDLKLKRGSSDLLVNGKIPGLFNYLLDRKAPLTITGSLVSEQIRLEDFVPQTTKSQSANDNPLIPANIRFSLKAEISHFTFGKFSASAISGEIDIKDQKAIISDMNMHTMQGEATLNAFADNSKNRLDVVLQGELKNIHIQSLFSEFNNFGQTTLQDRNINGFASATIDFSATWSNKMDISYPSIKSSCSLLVEKGELIDFKPLMKLSKFVDVQELQHIRFSTLQSNIRIANNTITIPKTSIKNSALDIDFWGTHTFDNTIDYHIRLVISEMLAKKRKHKDDEFGPIENDKEKKIGTFILMKGPLDNPVITYDVKGLREKIKSDIKEEKQNMRQILKEELGLFKKDSTHRKHTPEAHFELEKPGNNPPKKTLELKKKQEDDEDF